MGQMISRSNAETLIEEQVAREIIEGAIKQSRAMQMFRRLPNMTSNKTKMKVLDALPLVYWQGSDNARKQLTKMAWDKKYIIAEEMAVIVPIPENVIDDADYDIWGEVRPRIEEAMGKKFDQAVFVGADKPTGFRADLLTSALNAGATITPGSNTLYQSINDAMTKVEESGYNVNGAVGGVDLKGKDLGPNLSQRKKEAKQWNGFKENNKRPNTVRNGNYPKLKKEIEPFATRFLESASGEYAKSYKMLSQMMGHSSIKITLDLYSHLTEETVKTEIDKFSNYMDRMVFA